jgi:hypothetical protein
MSYPANRRCKNYITNVKEKKLTHELIMKKYFFIDRFFVKQYLIKIALAGQNNDKVKNFYSACALSVKAC